MPRAIEVVDFDRVGKRVLVGRIEAGEVGRKRQRVLIVNLADEVAVLIDRMLQIERHDLGAMLPDLERGAGKEQHVAGKAGDPEGPVAEALDGGALIVLCGRVTDTALALGPLVHEFGWAADDWDRLAAGTICGHILECGAQATGGNFTRWWEVPDLWKVGYPIAEVEASGSFIVTKHPGTGGMVTVDTVSEQLVYEMGDPKSYITPDVTADFTSIRLAQEGDDRVRVSGIRGQAKTPFLKISASYLDGYKAAGQVTVSGPRAIEKARLAAEIVWKRLERAGVTFAPADRVTELLGVSGVLPGILAPPTDPPEVVLRLAVRDMDRSKVDRFGKEIAPLVTAGPPGVTGFAGGRPKAQEVVAYWPALLAREEIERTLEVSVEAI